MANHPSFLTYLVQAIEQYRADRQPEVAPEPGPTSKRSQRLVRWVLPNGGTLLIVLALLMTQTLWARPFQSALSAPGPSATTVNYQGRLADSAGVPLDGTYGMSLVLYDAATGGNPVWTEDHPAVTVSDGLFSVGLGSRTAGGIPTTTWNGDRYLEITVGGETLSPRELIRSVPIAGMALTVPDGAISASQLASGIGPSSAPLMNLVLLNDPIPVLSLSGFSGDIDTTLDLSTYVSDESVAVLVLANFWGSQSDLTRLWLKEPNTLYNTVEIITGRSGSEQGLVNLDPMQQINYRIHDGAGAEFRIFLIGYYEPIN